jgi:hypothetical protein
LIQRSNDIQWASRCQSSIYHQSTINLVLGGLGWSWSFAMGCRPWIISIGPWVDWAAWADRIGSISWDRFWCRSTWSFPDGGRKKVDWGYIWMLQGRCPKYTKGGVHWRFFQHCNLQNIRCKQSSCPTAAEPVEAEWSSPYRSWCKPVRTCSWTRSFPTSYGKYQSNIAQNSTYHSTSVCQHFYSNIARLLFTVEILLCHSYACLHVRKPWAKIAKGLCRNRVQGPKSHGHLEAGLEKTELTTSLKDMNTCLHLSSLPLGWFVARDLGSTWKPKARSRLWVALATKLHGIAAWGHTSDDCRGYALASRIWQPHVS